MGTDALALRYRLPSHSAPLVGAFAGLFVFLLKDWLEANMARHMLIELTVLVIAGAGLGSAIPKRLDMLIGRCNQLGLSGFVLASLTLAYWMIPAALDAAVLHGPVNAAKYTSLIVCGALLPSSFRAGPLAVQAFFVGNLGWMMATVGLIYQNNPQQLCVNYLVDEQSAAGEGLVAAAVIVACTWCAIAAPGLLRDT